MTTKTAENRETLKIILLDAMKKESSVAIHVVTC